MTPQTALAPTGLEMERPKPGEPSFEKWVRGFFKRLSQEDEVIWNEIYSVSELNSLFVQGKQLLQRSSFTNGWRVVRVPDEVAHTVKALNVMRFYCNNIKAKWVQSAGKFNVRAGKDTDQAKAAARSGKVIAEHYRRQWFTPYFRQREVMRAMASGTFFRRVYYSPDADGGTAEREIIESRSVSLGPGPAQCLSCGKMGTTDLFQIQVPQENGMAVDTMQCPDCGSPDIQAEQLPEMQVPMVTGKVEYSCGELVCESVPIFDLRFDLSSRLEESPWLICRRRIRREIINSKYPGVKAGGGDMDEGSRMKGELQRSGQALSGRAFTGSPAENSDQHVGFVEMWLDPSMYGDYQVQTPVTLASGVTIEAGPLIEQFPNGLCVVGLDGFNAILGVYDEHHRDHWISSAFHVKAESGVGDGVQDMIEVQKRFNQVDTQIYTHLRSSATPAVLFDEDLLPGDKAKYLGMPQMNMPVKLSRLPETRKLSDAVHTLPPGNMSGQIVQYTQNFLNNMFQLTSQVTDFSGGLPGVNNGTATGAQIAAANANSLHAPQLQLLADADKRTIELALKLYQKNFPDKRWFALADRHGAQDGLFLKGSELCTDVVIEVLPESYLPQTTLEKRERTVQFLTVVGGLQGILIGMQQAPEIMSRLSELYDLELGMDEYGIAAQLGRRRIEQMKTGLQQLQQFAQVLPGAMAVSPVMFLSPMPDPHEPGHLAAVQYYRNWLITDEGLDADPLLRLAIIQLCDMHLQFAMLVASAAAGVTGQPAGPDGEGEDDGEGNPNPPQGGGSDNEEKPRQTPSQERQDTGRRNMKQPQPGASAK